MRMLSKIAIAGLAGVAAPMMIAGEALAGPVGAAASAVSPIRAPVEKVHSTRYGVLHHYHHDVPSRQWGARRYPRHYQGASWGHYPARYGWGWRPRYYGGGYGASPTFTTYSPAGAVSYPVYRIDNYRIDYSSPTFVNGAGW